MIAPGPRDIVIKKQKPSGFFGTNLASYLTLLGCDSVIVVGTTTSGCVRATAVDAFSLNYRVILAEEGCFDRSEASHAVSLCDMHAKYADVVSTADGSGKHMPDELIDLTKIKPSETFGRFDKTDLIILLTTGGVGYLAREGDLAGGFAEEPCFFYGFRHLPRQFCIGRHSDLKR